MEKIRVNEEQVFNYVRRGLNIIGYPYDMEISCNVGNDSAVYFANYTDDQNDRHIKPLKVSDIITLVKLAMEDCGYDAPKLDIRVNDGEVHYSVYANIVTYGNKGSGKRRR